MTAPNVSAEAARLRRAIFARCRQARIDDDARRAVQYRTTGKASLTQMSTKEMEDVLLALGGTAPRQRPSADLPDGPHTAKLRALWISAYWLGVVRDRGDAALAAWLRRQTGLDAARWATPAQTASAIEAAKDWLTREAGVDWSPYAAADGPPRHAPGARLLEALWRKLHAAGAVRIADHGALHAWVTGWRRDAAAYQALPAAELNELIRELGAWLRKATA